MWLEIVLLHIFKKEKMFMVHIRGLQMHSGNKVAKNEQIQVKD